MLGLIFIVLGVLFIFEEAGIIQGGFWGYFWPIILIAVGINMMKKDKQGMNCWSFCGQPKKKDNHKVVDEQ